MKKIVLLLIAGLSFSFAQAQIGVKVGVNYSNLAGQLQTRFDKLEEINDANKFGFVGGITTNFPLTSDGFLSIGPEILFSQKGYKYADEEYSFPLTVGGITTTNKYKYTGKVEFSYIDVPVLLKVKAGPLVFEAGPVGSYLLGIRDKTERTLNNADDESVQRISKEGLTKFEVGYAAGVGFQIPMGLNLSLRYNGSISHLADDGDNDNLQNSRHSLFQAMIGFALPSTK
jgi:hypothetical protein